MQGNWQNMVQQQEVMPPEGVWDAIALALDEAVQKPSWEKTIYDATVEPPTNAWQQIAQQLDAAQAGQQGWQQRIYQYESAPPVESWQVVSEMLDKQAANADWDARLYNQQATPPQEVWAYVAAQINTDIAPVVPISQNPVRKLGALRIAVAAITVLAVAGTAIWLMRDKFTSNNPYVATNNSLPTVRPSQVNAPATVNANTAVVQPVASPATTTQATIALAAKNTDKKTLPYKRPVATIAPLEYVTHNEMAFLPTDAVLANTNKLPNDKGQTVVEINGMDTPNSNYINISGPDGQSIRVSAKFANLLGYLNDGGGQEERLDRIIKESAFWKATFRQWREKMTDADAAPSPSNFMGLLEMIKVIQ